MERNLGEVTIFETPQALAEGLADLFVEEARTALEAHGRFLVSLAGGTTPSAAYALLAQEPRSVLIPWEKVHVFFGDERCVPQDSPLSNYRTAREALLQHVSIPRQNIHRIRGEIEPIAAAEEYALLLKRECGDPPKLDLMMLGLGPDAHTASLFPGTNPMTDDVRLVRVTRSQETQTYRVTVTPYIINNSRTVVIATEGTEKATAFAAVRGDDYNPTKYPAQIVSPKSGRLLWYVDRLASELI
jgi:6-phosphogluconolactonase